MPNLALILKDEIRRLARKEVRAHVAHTQRQVAQHRREIARLKRVLATYERRLATVTRLAPRPKVPAEAPDGTRFSARSVRAQRRRLRLSLEDFGKLVGVTSKAIYFWEQGRS